MIDLMINSEGLKSLAVNVANLLRIPLDRIKVEMIYRPDFAASNAWKIKIVAQVRPDQLVNWQGLGADANEAAQNLLRLIPS